MLSLLTPDNIDKVLIAVGGVVTAIGGLTLRKVMKEPPKPGTPDAVTLALAENTKATRELVAAVLEMVAGLKAQNAHFGENNDMFKAMGPVLGVIARDLSDIRHDTADSKSHLSGIKDALNRR